ncbi:hypothetical protein Taro_008972 [Colocasia esculenta]|uniref:TF-B3 domain-containing protein n=1 Tax=Colocasia esculenta TaxID=4460 RepID=A0A843U3H1_COLES|nr:hypothetical protein [Colocasia esculenta]
MYLLERTDQGLRYVLHKELKNSDVTSLGRIVLPKRESEIYLPFLAVKEGIQLTVKDMFSPDAWRMRYRFWPNNKSRMYVLENTGTLWGRRRDGRTSIGGKDYTLLFFLFSCNTIYIFLFFACNKSATSSSTYVVIIHGLS